MEGRLEQGEAGGRQVWSGREKMTSGPCGDNTRAPGEWRADLSGRGG